MNLCAVYILNLFDIALMDNVKQTTLSCITFKPTWCGTNMALKHWCNTVTPCGLFSIVQLKATWTAMWHGLNVVRETVVYLSLSSLIQLYFCLLEISGWMQNSQLEPLIYLLVKAYTAVGTSCCTGACSLWWSWTYGRRLWPHNKDSCKRYRCALESQVFTLVL